MDESSPETQLEGFLSRYTPEIAAQAAVILAKMRERLPGALELVYDNYNALAVGFGPSERASEAIFSIAIYPRWVSLFFLQGSRLPDPKKLLQGTGSKARHFVLNDPADLDSPAIQSLMKHALKMAAKPLDVTQTHRIIIKSISEKQRSRRPK